MKYLCIGCMIFFFASCSGVEEQVIPEREHAYETIIESTPKDITETQEFGDCVEPTVKMCITQVANELARKENSLTFCEKLSQSEEIQSCKYGVVVQGLSNENAITACDILDEKYKRECRAASLQISALNEENGDTCDQILEEFAGVENENVEGRVDQCKFSIIMKMENPTKEDCSTLSETSQKDSCLSMVQAKSTKK